jgi:DNA mismatch repair protein MutL
MGRIQQLPPAVVTKIAAGEVIERPASVVKELLENAVDAGSHRIDLAVEQGGVELIRVVDDGCGIVADDQPLAFASHATSKLSSADDLFRIATLGFRGEALAAIGGVAQVTLQSRPPEQPHGAEVSCHGGTLSETRAWNGSGGTRVEVRHLFYNTPVRRKFLRGLTTEMGHVSEVFTRLALSPHAPHLLLRHNDRLCYDIPISADLLDHITKFFGTEVRDLLLPVEADTGSYRLSGYLADPSCERGHAQLQYFFVNGRWVRNRLLGQALQEAYQGLLMTGRYAVAFLFLNLPPDQVDVNVHPSKAEVRFRDTEAVRQLVLGAAQQALRAGNLTPRFRAPARTGERDQPILPQKALWPEPPAATLRGPAHEQASAPRRVDHALAPAQPAAASPALSGDRSSLPAAAAVAQPDLPTCKAIQVYNTYLIVEAAEGLLLIDQHALHERILFEQLKQRLRAGPLETQRLLIPVPLDLPGSQVALLEEHRSALATLGLHVEGFGGNTVLLTSYPVILGKRAPQETLRAVLDYLVSKDRPPSQEQLLYDLLSLTACHAAVRSGDALLPEEIAALVAQRALAQDLHHCPHGRPTSLLFTRQDLDRQFRRLV